MPVSRSLDESAVTVGPMWSSKCCSALGGLLLHVHPNRWTIPPTVCADSYTVAHFLPNVNLVSVLPTNKLCWVGRNAPCPTNALLNVPPSHDYLTKASCVTTVWLVTDTIFPHLSLSLTCLHSRKQHLTQMNFPVKAREE